MVAIASVADTTAMGTPARDSYSAGSDMSTSGEDISRGLL